MFNQVSQIRVAHFSTYDTSGGAAIAARRSHRALQCEGVNSSMYVKGKSTRDSCINIIDQNQTFRSRLNRFTYRKSSELYRQMNGDTPTQRSVYFSDGRASGHTFGEILTDADVIHLHWITEFIDYATFFSSLPARCPVVWTLHDMNALTGGCHNSDGCSHFKFGCGNCHLLTQPRPNDLSRRVFERKSSILHKNLRKPIQLVAPSNWMGALASDNVMFPDFDVSVIPNCVDTDVFFPRDRNVARDMLGIPHDAKVVLFVADHLNSYMKGMDLLAPLLHELRGRYSKIQFLAVGDGMSFLPDDVITTGRQKNDSVLAHIYSTADLFVSPTRADNLPNVLIEAMACGTPAVAFDVGGIRDIIVDGVNGCVVPKEDRQALLQAMDYVLTTYNVEDRKNISSLAVKNFSPSIHAQRLLKVYSKAISDVYA
jgi:glycosyltransferase involved in cell wall biosynthesis